MTVQKILESLTSEDILEAISTFPDNAFKKVKDKYTLNFNGRGYPARDLVMRASKGKLRMALNAHSYTTVYAKRYLIKLGFKDFGNHEIMYRYYIKKISDQDVTRTPVVNKAAAKGFFEVNLENRDDEELISLRYDSTGAIDNGIRIYLKQDVRINLDKDGFAEGHLLFFYRIGQGQFALRLVKKDTGEYQVLEPRLTNNYMLTNEDLIGVGEEGQMTGNDRPEFPLNQILYGPPGTGKTYSTVTMALDIIGIEYDKDDYGDAQEKFKTELGKRIEFVTMHQSFSYEDFVQGLKPVKRKKKEGIVFDYKDGVFKDICRRAENSMTGDEPELRYIPNKDICTIAFYLSKFNGKKKNEKKANEALGYGSDSDAFIKIGELIGEKSNSLKNHRDKFDYAFHNREGYTERKGWKPRNDKGELDNTDKWPYQVVFKELDEKSFDDLTKIVKEIIKKPDSVNAEEDYPTDNFVIILDEINRANISRVFGELIALIEEDKRGGNLYSTLPSGEPFAVPSNLYIIGTMNTADKSIALVDIALRRRFRFTGLYPDKDKLTNELKIKGFQESEIEKRVYLMEAINAIIRSKKSVDFEIGHSYFMSKNDLEEIIEEQIIPLLLEYFMYAAQQVKNLMEKTVKTRNNKPLKKTGLLFDVEWFEERGLLRLARDGDGKIKGYAVPGSGTEIAPNDEFASDQA